MFTSGFSMLTSGKKATRPQQLYDMTLVVSGECGRRKFVCQNQECFPRIKLYFFAEIKYSSSQSIKSKCNIFFVQKKKKKKKKKNCRFTMRNLKDILTVEVIFEMISLCCGKTVTPLSITTNMPTSNNFTSNTSMTSSTIVQNTTLATGSTTILTPVSTTTAVMPSTSNFTSNTTMTVSTIVQNMTGSTILTPVSTTKNRLSSSDNLTTTTPMIDSAGVENRTKAISNNISAINSTSTTRSSSSSSSNLTSTPAVKFYNESTASTTKQGSNMSIVISSPKTTTTKMMNSSTKTTTSQITPKTTLATINQKPTSFKSTQATTTSSRMSTTKMMTTSTQDQVQLLPGESMEHGDVSTKIAVSVVAVIIFILISALIIICILRKRRSTRRDPKINTTTGFSPTVHSPGNIKLDFENLNDASVPGEFLLDKSMIDLESPTPENEAMQTVALLDHATDDFGSREITTFNPSKNKNEVGLNASGIQNVEDKQDSSDNESSSEDEPEMKEKNHDKRQVNQEDKSSPKVENGEKALDINYSMTDTALKEDNSNPMATIVLQSEIRNSPSQESQRQSIKVSEL